MKHETAIRVRKISRQPTPSRIGAEVAIVIDTLEESPHLGVMKARIDRMLVMEKLLRDLQWSGKYSDGHGDLYSECPICGEEPGLVPPTPGMHAPSCRLGLLLAELDAADRTHHPDHPWDVLTLDGKPAPAHCRVRLDRIPSPIDRKGMVGYGDLGQFDIELLVLPENVQACEDFVRELWPFKAGEAATLTSHQVDHPYLAFLGIAQIAVIGVRSGEGPEPGTRLFVLRVVEYHPKKSPA